MPESNGSNNSDRLDRIERAIEFLVTVQGDMAGKQSSLTNTVADLTNTVTDLTDTVADMARAQSALQQDVKNLYVSQVVMGDSLNRLTAEVTKLTIEVKDGFAELRESQRHTDDRLNSLISVVHRMIRNRNPE